MIKRKQKGVIVSTFVALIAIVIIIGIAFIKTTDLEENKTNIIGNMDNTIQKDSNLENEEDKNVADNLPSSNTNDNNENIDEDERAEIEKYIYKICNNTLNERLSECNNINDVDKNWIYSHIKSVDNPYYVTKEQVEKQLQDLFGEKLNIDVENDIKNIDDLVLSKAYEDEGKYALPIYGMDNTTYYTIDQVMKKNEQYIVKVIEFNRSYDMINDEEGKETIISTYDENIDDGWKWREVFRIESNKLEKSDDKYLPSPTLSQEVLKRKNEFLSYTITIEKNSNGAFIVKSIER